MKFINATPDVAQIAHDTVFSMQGPDLMVAVCVGFALICAMPALLEKFA